MGLTLLEIQSLTASLAANGRVPSTVPAPASTGTVTGLIPAAGATATAGSGFTYTHTNGTGIYVFTFTAAFGATPIVLIQPCTSQFVPYITAGPTTTGFTVTIIAVGGSTTDEAFGFVAQSVA